MDNEITITNLNKIIQDYRRKLKDAEELSRGLKQENERLKEELKKKK